ncbi:hypothetical protein KM043_013559 [Ampulex compressa]|nr:hypothetical protein KM043_013559 [Ampulex compressa]
MAFDSFVLGLLIFGCSMQVLSAISENDPLEYMSKGERELLKEEARDMFYHAYNAYMDNAYPADELMPLSCKGRYRGSEPNRGDIDSTLGNFSLTLVDTLDTLVVLGDFEEFEKAIKLVAKDVNFDTDVIVSLFETNIRMLGGLLSGHILAEYLQQRADIIPWYRGELLKLAKDLGYRFLPAFNTTTGIPYGRINLKYGMKGVPMEVSRETCTACAGSMILEMAALSRLTGESIFEEKAQKAMDVLWKMRHRGTDLMGSVLNVNSGDWVRRDSGVGAGIDSYYEYCLKAYILLGDEKYLGRFNKHYQAVMKYVSQGPMLLDVHMHRPNTNSKNFMDALLAFWPGLQVLKGDIKPAVETHEMLYQVMQRHNFIPEAFTIDFQVLWGHHPLRPEFLESTYFLYRATGDHYYLGVGRKVLKSLQTYARVPCGYAAVSDVRTNKHDDTMDSFVLSETFKYLFLLFADPGELVLDLDEFIFTTEGHLLPLTLASVRTNISSEFERDVHVDELDRTCPNSLHLFPATVRQPLRNMVEDICPRRSIKRRLSASQFQANNLEHLKMLSDMGITTLTLADGRVQLLHTFSNVETKPQSVTFIMPETHPPQKITLLAGPAHFGLDLQGSNKVTGKIVFTYPHEACSGPLNSESLVGKIVIMLRGSCMFIEKARRIQQAGAIAGVVLDNVPGTSAATSPMFAMSGDGKDVDDVVIPIVFLFSMEAIELRKAIIIAHGDLSVTLGNFISNEEVQLKAPTDLSIFERFKGSLKSFLTTQTTPQALATGGTNLDTTLFGVKQQEDNMYKNVIIFNELRAEIIEDVLGGEVRITALYTYVRVVRPSEQSTSTEKQWHQLKEIFIHQLYSDAKEKPTLKIRSFILKDYYDWVMKARGIEDDIQKMPFQLKVLWLLKELVEVASNPSVMRMGHLEYLNKQRLRKQYLFTKMDAMVLNMKTLMTIMEGKKIDRSITCHNCRMLVLQMIAHYKFMQRLLRGILEENDENSARHIAFLEEHVRAAKDIEDQEVGSNHFRGTISAEASYYNVLLHGLKKEFANFKRLDVLKKTIEDNLMAAELLMDNEADTTDIVAQDTYNAKNKDLNLGKFEYFILTEIEKAMKKPEQSSFQNPEENSSIINSPTDNKSEEIANSNSSTKIDSESTLDIPDSDKEALSERNQPKINRKDKLNNIKLVEEDSVNSKMISFNTEDKLTTPTSRADKDEEEYFTEIGLQSKSSNTNKLLSKETKSEYKEERTIRTESGDTNPKRHEVFCTYGCVIQFCILNLATIYNQKDGGSSKILRKKTQYYP